MRFPLYVNRDPIVLQAFRFDWDKVELVQSLCTVRPVDKEMRSAQFLLVVTPLGTQQLNAGDFMMCNHHGAWYPVNSEIFEKLYRRLEENELTAPVELDTPAS